MKLFFLYNYLNHFLTKGHYIFINSDLLKYLVFRGGY